MAEEFESPVGIRSDTSTDTWSLVVGSDGNLELRSNSPTGGGESRVILDDDTGTVFIGTSANPAVMNVTDDLTLTDAQGTIRLRLDAQNQRLEIMDLTGELIGMIGGAANIRAGSNGENGDLLLYNSNATDIFNNADATVRANGRTGDLVLGGSRTNGDIFLQDTAGTVRVRLRSASQRLELLNDSGEIIGMMGGSANVRAGTNGENGDIHLFPASATNIFSNGDATASMSGASGDLMLGGNGINGDALLRDGEDTVRVRLSSSSQRLEVSNRQGQIIGMIGGGGNIRAGTGGENGALFLYGERVSNIFSNSEASISLEAATGAAMLGGNGVGGNAFLRDSNGTTRAQLSAANQRLELRDSSGNIISMMGGAANIRAGTNGEAGDLYLFPAGASDIFDNNQASIRMNGESGDIVLQNADFAEDFDIDPAQYADAAPGSVMVLQNDGTLVRCTQAYDPRIVGVISGAGAYRPGIVMDNRDDGTERRPIALVGKVFCNVDARSTGVETGDLLTSSSTEGHAMKATDRDRAFGAVLGKALAPLATGTGQIPVLVNLQ